MLSLLLIKGRYDMDAVDMDAEEARATREKLAEARESALLVDANRAAGLCGLGRTSWLKLNAMGKTPEPIRLGRRVLWRIAELRAWVDKDCPPRHKWEWSAATREKPGQPKRSLGNPREAWRGENK